MNIVFFPHVTRACEGVVFDSVETVKTLISRTSTSKGLTTIVHILDKYTRQDENMPLTSKK
ncbi:hypothetical protein [Bathymodiolus platifrons methanotrophic gill symbiont]|uniref:hypothetical protein n=1 Tax=Bathymodiolus platifrons methanotrophic gill symbiont TaxID=113268 RepID=UPI001C8E95B9|nr:hypothetical protein [Bathymodiolus platifrons methanotrophic gill symbiont]